MDSLPLVPVGGRCVCGAWLFVVRQPLGYVGAALLFECRRCRKQYRPQHEAWSPTAPPGS